jgi:hypothetical protein
MSRHKAGDAAVEGRLATLETAVEELREQVADLMRRSP